VFDNASSDGSTDFIASSFPSVIILKSKSNLGFAEGNNKAIQFALDQKADYIFLLNNDTQVEPNLLEELVARGQIDSSIGIIGPSIYDYNNRTLLQEAGMTIDRFGFPIPINCVSAKHNASEPLFVSGCALLVKAIVFKSIGLFDSTYFMFAEDLDLCWRTQLAGYRVVINDMSCIYHASGGSMSGGVAKAKRYSTDVRRVFLREKNTLRTLIKNYDINNLSKIFPLYLLLLSLESAMWLVLLKPRVCLCILKAIIWNITVLPDTLKQRQQVQFIRKLSDENITQKMFNSYGKLYVFRLIKIPRFTSSK
jgi:GT2 family glycosyltransferase